MSGLGTNDTDCRKTLVILDASSAVTGGLRCATRMAEILKPWVQTVLVLPAGSHVDQTELGSFAAVERLPMVQLRKSVLAGARYLPALLVSGWRLARLLKELRADRLVVNDFFQAQGWVARRAGYRGRVLTFVRFDPVRFPAPVRRLWLGAAARAGTVIAVSQFIRRRLPAELGAEVIYDSIDPGLTRQRDLGTAGKNIVALGNYIRGKGQDHALNAFSRIATRFPDTRLVFHGSDMGLEKNRAFKAELERLAARLGLADRVIFGSFATNVAEVYASARVALNLSESESFSLTCLEASQLGVPVVAFRSGGPEEIVKDKHTGFLCDLHDLDGVAKALSRLLSDADVAREMGEAGAERVRAHFGPERYAAAMRRVLELE